jgi:hypothetical protein
VLGFLRTLGVVVLFPERPGKLSELYIMENVWSDRMRALRIRIMVQMLQLALRRRSLEY